jgi:hypothetical protein
VHIDVLRVAAARRQLDGKQHRRLGRARVIGVVGVECLARDDALAVFDLVVGYVVHAGMARHVPLLLVVRLNLTEELGGGRELVRREVLVAHDQHVMLGEGAAQDGLVAGIDRLGEVEPGDLKPGVSRERRDGQPHGMTLDASSVSTGR